MAFVDNPMDGTTSLAPGRGGQAETKQASAGAESRLSLIRELIAYLGLPVMFGFLVRFVIVQSSDFPLNDGGMFYAMVEDLQSAHLTLPTATSYNGLDIPFTYPPLAFYLMAIIQGITGTDLIELFRLVPLFISVATIVAFYALSRTMLPTRFGASVATMAFALIPRGFNWEIVGGGITRGLGLLFAILAIQQGYQMLTQQRRRHVVGLVVVGSLTVLSHLEMAVFVAITLGLVHILRGRSMWAIAASAIAATAIAMLTSPWWVTNLLRHGLAPFLSAAQTGGHSLTALMYPLVIRFTDEPFHAVLAVLAAVGACVCIASRKSFFPLWFVALFILDPRKAPTEVTLPTALMVSVCITEFLIPQLSRRTTWRRAEAEVKTDAPAHFGELFSMSRRTALVLGLLLLYCTLSAMGTPLEPTSPLQALAPSEREAMTWVKQNAPSDGKFLVFANDRGETPSWPRDQVSEWFPVLAERQSIATVQGYEWLGRDKWDYIFESYKAYQLCSERDAECIEALARQGAPNFSHVYVPKSAEGEFRYSDCCAAIRIALAVSPQYTAIYDGPGATIFARKVSGQ